jgi:hypothetical protein
MKKASGNVQDETFAKKYNLYTECLILGNASTMEKITQSQILTDSGIYYVGTGVGDIEVGGKYRLRVKDSIIEKVYYKVSDTDKIQVYSLDGNKVYYQTSSRNKNMVLPDNAIYYYNGQKQNYDNLKTVIKRGMSITFAYDNDGLGYSSAVINDPADYRLGSYNECIILGDSKTDDKLAKNQVSTDKGLYFIDSSVVLETGKKYGLIIKDDTIVKSMLDLNTVNQVSVDGFADNMISYLNKGQNKTITLSEKTNFYYKGEKQTYEMVKTLLKGNSSVIFGEIENSLGYEYAVILDPVYSAPEIAVGVSTNKEHKFGAIDLNAYSLILKDGKAINYSSLEERDVLYKVTNVWDQNPYILVQTNKAEGILTGILPDKSSPQYIQVDGRNYEISKFLDLSVISGTNNSYKVDDKVSCLLSYDNKIIGISPLVYKSGPFLDYIIMGNSRTNDTLSMNQVITDQGIYYLANGVVNLDLGNKYKLVVDGDTIVKVGEKQESLVYYAVDNLVENVIRYKDGEYTKTFALPQNIKYYYDGNEVTYASAKSKLLSNSTLTFAKNNQSTGYKYCVVFDPVYSEPVVNHVLGASLKQYGDIKLDSDTKVIKNGELVDYSSISYMDVLYQVTDIRGENKYIVVYNDKATGVINTILPNRLYPQSIKIGNTIYTFGKSANIDAISYSDSPFLLGVTVTVALGRNGEVLWIYFS